MKKKLILYLLLFNIFFNQIFFTLTCYAADTLESDIPAQERAFKEKWNSARPGNLQLRSESYNKSTPYRYEIIPPDSDYEHNDTTVQVLRISDNNGTHYYMLDGYNDNIIASNVKQGTTFNKKKAEEDKTPYVSFEFGTNVESMLYDDKNNVINRGKIVQKEGSYRHKIINTFDVFEVEYNPSSQRYVQKFDSRGKTITRKLSYRNDSYAFSIGASSTSEHSSSGLLDFLADILKEIGQSLIELLSDTFSTLFESVIIPIIDSLLAFFGTLWSSFLKSMIGKLLHQLFVLMLILLDNLQILMNIIGGVDTVQFGDKQDFLVNIFLNQQKIRTLFFKITLIGVVLAFLFTVYVTILHTVSPGGRQPRTIGNILASGFKAMLTFITMPFLFLLLVNLVNMSLRQIVRITSQNINESMTIGSYIYAMTVYTSKIIVSEGTTKYTRFDSFLKEFNTIQPIYKNPKVLEYCEVGDINYLIGLLCAIVGLFIFLVICLSFVVKIFEILVLYLIAPFFTASIPLDSGMSFKKWRNMLVAKVIVGYSVLVMVNIFFLLAPLIVSDSFLLFEGSDFSVIVDDIYAKILFILAGLLAISRSDELITQLVNWEAGGGATETMRTLTDPIKAKIFNKDKNQNNQPRGINPKTGQPL